MYCIHLSPLWLKFVPGWPAISVITLLSAISQLTSRVGEGWGVSIALYNLTLRGPGGKSREGGCVPSPWVYWTEDFCWRNRSRFWNLKIWTRIYLKLLVFIICGLDSRLITKKVIGHEGELTIICDNVFFSCPVLRIRDPEPFWTLDPGWVKYQNPDPDRGWTSRIIFPGA